MLSLINHSSEEMRWNMDHDLWIMIVECGIWSMEYGIIELRKMDYGL